MDKAKVSSQNQFLQKLRVEYEVHISRIFGCTFEEYLNVIPGGEKKFYEDCKNAFDQGGMPALRYIMKSNIATLDFMYFMRTEDKEWFFEDFVQRAMSLGIGIRRDELVPWTWSSMSEKEGIIQYAANDVE